MSKACSLVSHLNVRRKRVCEGETERRRTIARLFVCTFIQIVWMHKTHFGEERSSNDWLGIWQTTRTAFQLWISTEWAEYSNFLSDNDDMQLSTWSRSSCFCLDVLMNRYLTYLCDDGNSPMRYGTNRIRLTFMSLFQRFFFGHAIICTDRNVISIV